MWMRSFRACDYDVYLGLGAIGSQPLIENFPLCWSVLYEPFYCYLLSLPLYASFFLSPSLCDTRLVHTIQVHIHTCCVSTFMFCRMTCKFRKDIGQLWSRSFSLQPRFHPCSFRGGHRHNHVPAQAAETSCSLSCLLHPRRRLCTATTL